MNRSLSSRQTKKQKYSVVWIPPCCVAGRNFSRWKRNATQRDEMPSASCNKADFGSAVCCKKQCSVQWLQSIHRLNWICEDSTFQTLGFRKSLPSDRCRYNVRPATCSAAYGFFGLCVKHLACVLKSSVTVKQRMCIRICHDRIIKSVKNELVVVARSCCVVFLPLVI